MNNVSVIIPTKERHDEVINCLKSINKQSFRPYEVIIVDSSQTQELLYKLPESRKLNIVYVKSDIAGINYQMNLGVKNSSGNIIVFSDNDTIWSKNYLKELIRVFQERDNVGGVTGSPIIKNRGYLEEVNHELLDYYRKIFLLTSSGSGMFKRSGMASTLSKGIKNITECEFLYGFSMAFRREVFKEFWMDENVKGYSWGSDDDIAYRVSRKYQNYFTPFAKIYHIGNGGKGYRNSENEKRRMILGFNYLFQKNMPKTFLNKLCFRWAIFGIVLFESGMGLIRFELKGIRGVLKGLSEIIKEKNVQVIS